MRYVCNVPICEKCALFLRFFFYCGWCTCFNGSYPSPSSKYWNALHKSNPFFWRRKSDIYLDYIMSHAVEFWKKGLLHVTCVFIYLFFLGGGGELWKNLCGGVAPYLKISLISFNPFVNCIVVSLINLLDFVIFSPSFFSDWLFLGCDCSLIRSPIPPSYTHPPGPNYCPFISHLTTN